MPNQVPGVLPRAMSGTELSCVRTRTPATVNTHSHSATSSTSEPQVPHHRYLGNALLPSGNPTFFFDNILTLSAGVQQCDSRRRILIKF